jgi:hypothetical protein
MEPQGLVSKDPSILPQISLSPPSAILMARAKKIRSYSQFLTGEENQLIVHYQYHVLRCHI